MLMMNCYILSLVTKRMYAPQHHLVPIMWYFNSGHNKRSVEYLDEINCMLTGQFAGQIDMQFVLETD